MESITQIQLNLQPVKHDRVMVLKGNFSATSANEVHLSTSLYRELAYSLEHNIHHQALIKVGITQLHVNKRKPVISVWPGYYLLSKPIL